MVEQNNERWRGSTDARIDELERRMTEFESVLTPMRLAQERARGWAEGSKAMLLLVGALLGGIASQVASWLLKKV